jgi:hypothetical protein
MVFKAALELKVSPSLSTTVTPTLFFVFFLWIMLGLDENTIDIKPIIDGVLKNGRKQNVR